MRVLTVLLLFIAAPGLAQPLFRTYSLADKGVRLDYTDSQGVTKAAPRLGEQVAFSQPRISPDGKLIGWLALYPYCCTSYPIPLALVVLDSNQNLQTFQGAQATFGWCFQADSSAVAFRRAFLHGALPDQFELRRVADGALLDSFEAPMLESGAERKVKLPSWADCAVE